MEDRRPPFADFEMPEQRFSRWFRGLPRGRQWAYGVPILAGCGWATVACFVDLGATQRLSEAPGPGATSGEPQQAIWVTLILFVVVLILSELLRPKPKFEEARPKGLGDFQFPTATEGRPVPLLWGQVRIKGPNVVWYGDLQQVAIREKVKTGLWSSTTITKGFRYFLGVQFAICRGPGAVLKRVWVGDREIFAGTVVSEGFFDINEPDFLGGDEFGQGGIQASIDFYGGETTQVVNAFLDTVDRQRIATATTPSAPRYSGTVHLVMRQLTGSGPSASDTGAFIGNSTQIKPWAFEVQRFPALFTGQTAGQNVIGGLDANPINIIFELLTNTEWGFGLVEAQLDTGVGSTFDLASDSMIAEANGMSWLLDQQIPAQEILNEIQRQIEGVVFLNPLTALWEIQLVRGPDDPRFGYDIDLVPQFTDDIIDNIKDFTRGSWEDTTNNIQVQFDKRDDDYKQSFALAQDMANAIILAAGSFLDPESQAGLVSFPGVKNAALASNLAWRELRGQSFPLARASFVINRKFFDLTIGQVFAWTDTRLGFTKLPMRVTRIDYGTLTNNKMTVDAAQDVFEFAVASMGTPAATQWVEPVASLVAFPAAQQTAFEAPRGLITRAPDFNGDPLISRVWCGARLQGGGEVAFEIGQRNASGVPGGSFAFAGTSIQFVLIGQLDSDLDAGVANPTASILVNATPDSQTTLEAIFDDAATLQDLGVSLVSLIKVNDEFMLVADASDSGPDVNLQNVYRGVLGSGQAFHSANDDVFMIFIGGNLTDTVFDSLFNVDIELRMRSASSVFAGAVTTIGLTMARRAFRPYPPSAIQYNGTAADFGTPDLEGDGAGLNGVGFDIDWERTSFDIGDEIVGLLNDVVPDAALSTEFRVQIRTDPTGGNNLIFDSGWVSGTGPITPTLAALINQDAVETEMDVRMDARHDIATINDLLNRSPQLHRVTGTSATYGGLFYFGGDLRAGISSATFVVASATIHSLTIGGAYGVSLVQANINGAGFLTIIGVGLTTGVLNGGVALAISDTVIIRHQTNETPDPNWVELDDATNPVAYGAFSA